MSFNRYARMIQICSIPFVILLLLIGSFILLIELIQGNVTDDFIIAAIILMLGSLVYQYVIVPFLVVQINRVGKSIAVFTQQSVSVSNMNYVLNEFKIRYYKINLLNFLLFRPGLMILDNINNEYDIGHFSGVQIGYFIMADVDLLVNDLHLDITII